MIAQRYYDNDIPLPLSELVKIYNSSCPSLSTCKDLSYTPYILTSTILMEILLKRILFKLNGRYRGTHNIKTLADSFDQFGIELRKFSKEELEFLTIDHSSIRYTLNLYFNITLNESTIDGLFEYFISLAVSLGVE